MNLFNIVKERATHGARLERWLGADVVDGISKSMIHWQGPPIAMAGVPGNVWAHRGGDFHGIIRSGQVASAVEYGARRVNRIIQNFGQRQRQNLNTGFASLSDLIAEASVGKIRQFPFNKDGGVATTRCTMSMWGVGISPPAGAAPAAAPGGTAFDDSSTGAFPFTNPSGGDTQHFVKGEAVSSIAGQTLLLYDLIFGCAKTMNSTATEAVTGVPTRYQSITPGDQDYAGGNFLFVQTGGTVLSSGAHNWTVCTYLDQGGNASTLPSIVGNSANAVHRLDHPVGQWFAPLESTDTGVKTLTQMQCSALIATGVTWFMIGHPICIMPVPIANIACVTDGIMTAFSLVRIFDDAALTFLEIVKPSTSNASYTGMLQTVAG